MPASRLGRQPRWVAFALGWVGMGAIAFATYRFNDGTSSQATRRLCRPWVPRRSSRPGSGPRRPLQDRHVCLDWVLSGGRRADLLLVVPVALAAARLRRYPLGKTVTPRRHGRPSRLLRPCCCDQSPHREASLEDPHPISPQSTRPWRGVHRLLGRPGFAALCGKAERSRGTGEPGRGSAALQNGHSLQKSA